jgi:hypothetical protein
MIQKADIPASLIIEPLTCEWPLADPREGDAGTAILLDREDAEGDDRCFIEVLVSDCLALSPRKLVRGTLLLVIAMDWSHFIRELSPESITPALKSKFTSDAGYPPATI